MPVTLGLDIGPNSVGWALVDTDADRIVDLGVRIFPEGVDNFDTKKEKPRNEDRQIARSMRRQTRRRAERKRRVKQTPIDLGLFPLGSCTMKHNPRLDEKVARMPGFADIHPLQPQASVQGALEVIDQLAHWLKELTGMPAVAMSPKAGAHGELCGVLAIRAALDARGEQDRRVMLVPESAHGTNPATAAFANFTTENIPATPEGRVDVAALKARHGPDIAGAMITNPNTCGLFERDMREICDAVHDAGGYVYCDGANFNALVGRVRPGDLGIDAMHLNLHKTFSTPHGGGGPGRGQPGDGQSGRGPGRLAAAAGAL